MDKENIFKLQRVRTPETIEAFKAELSNYDWKEVYVEDTNDSYNAFLAIFKSLYDYYCPVRKVKVKPKNKQNLWMTKGLVKACKKKEQLYKDFIKHRTKDKAYKYKQYRNRLTTIIREQKQNYYRILLGKYKANIKATWDVIKEVIDQHNISTLPTYIVKDDSSRVENVQEIANEFNIFFC